MAIAAGIDRVFEVGPVFRAEPSYTSRHATEFTGVDAELAWVDGLDPDGERRIMLGLESLRDAVFLFRGPTRLTP